MNAQQTQIGEPGMKIVKLISVTDTREYEEQGDRVGILRRNAQQIRERNRDQEMVNYQLSQLSGVDVRRGKQREMRWLPTTIVKDVHSQVRYRVAYRTADAPPYDAATATGMYDHA